MSIFIYPTDTVIGIGCSIYDEKSYFQILDAKKSAKDKPTSIIFNSLDMMKRYIIDDIDINIIFSETWFNYELTVCLEKELFNLELIPKWIYQKSDLIAFRIINNNEVNNIINTIKSPLTTTSLNITGDEPITDYNDALSFKKNYLKSALISDDLNVFKNNYSGEPSTILVIKREESSQKYSYLRKGYFFNKIEREIEIFST